MLRLLLILTLTLVSTPELRAQADLAAGKKRATSMIVGDRAKEAIPLLTRLGEKYPADAETKILLGEAHFALDDFEAAIPAFESGLAIRPELRGQSFNLGRAYHKTQRHDEARQVYAAMQEQTSVTLRSKGYFGLGLLLEDEGEDEQAIAAFRKSIEIDPSSYRPRYRLALGELQAGNNQEAADQFAIVLKAKPLHHGAAFNLSLALLRLGKRDEGKRMKARHDRILKGKQKISGLKMQLEEQPRNWQLLVELGREYSELEAWRDAVRWYDRARRAAPPSPDIMFGFARALQGMGDMQNAERAYRFLLDQKPPDRRAVEPLIEILTARGDFEGVHRLRQRFGEKPAKADGKP